MKITITQSTTPIVVTLQGRLDTAAAAEATPDFQSINQYASRHIIIDCTELDYIASSGLRLFLGLRKEVASKGGKLQIRAINNNIRQVFAMTGFLSLFEII